MTNTKFTMRQLFSIIILCFVLQLQTVNGQNEVQKIKFSSVNSIGLTSGQSGEAAVLQTINGIKKGKSFAGIGAGLDFYVMRSVPLFADFRRDLFSANTTPFAYADIGSDFLWLRSDLKPLQSVSKTGLYYDIGVGWKLSGKKNEAFIVSAGYSLKQVRYDLPSFQFAPTYQLQAENAERLSYLYKRIIIKIGFQF